MSLELGPGEVVALVGENGAGKSSLMNVLYGLYRPDAGELYVKGEKVAFHGPADAIRRGIGMVHQHFMLVPTLTVAENVVLGNEPRRRGLFDRATACAQVEETARRFGFTLDPRARIEHLSVGSQQKVEIVKALHRGAEVLILDEPTAVLTPQEADELFEVARQLAAKGHTVVFISHKLREVLSVAHRIAVMRGGRKVTEVQAADTTPEQLAELMVGAVPLSPHGDRAVGEGWVPGPNAPSSAELDQVHAARSDGTPALRGVSLHIRPGEIVGIAGVDGNGQRELAGVLTGLCAISGGTVRILGKLVAGGGKQATPQSLRDRGVGHIPEDRLLRAIVGPMSVEENLALGRHTRPPYARGPWIDFPGRHRDANRLIESFDVRPRDPDARIQSLSGGNQQKVVVARELDAAPKLLVVVQPTRGLDLAAVAQVHEGLREAKRRGAAVLLVSLDLSEVLALSDRLYVLYDGRITGDLSRDAFDERRIGRLMLGASDTATRGTEVAHG